MKLNTNQILASTFVIALLVGGLSGMLGANLASDSSDTPDGEASFTLIAYITGYEGEGGDIDGVVNPTLEVEPGTEVTLTVISGEAVTHDLAIDELDVNTELIQQDSDDYADEVTVTFVVEEGQYTYYCTVAGHSSTMSGLIIAGDPVTLDDAKPVDVDQISRDPRDTGTKVGSRTTNMHLNFTLVASEVVAEIEDGTTFTYWTFNKTTPGPMIRAMVGDTLTISLYNEENSTQEHSVDLHAVTGTGGGAAILRSDPGETTSLTFVAKHEGSFVYHCASPHIPTHISKGMFGGVLIEPNGGLPEVDVELFLGQNEVYTSAPMGTAGHQEFDGEAQRAENPSYVLLNGAAAYLTGDNAINVTQNDTVRIIFSVGGPNLVSSFHIIGEIWDKVWYETSYTSGPNMKSAETVLVAPGSVLTIELTMEEIGSYLLVDHALSRVFDKGFLGVINVNAA